MKLPEATEHQIQTMLINYLRAKGWYVMRLNTGKYSVGEGKYKRFIMGQEVGTPDVMAFKANKKYLNLGSELVFIEVKRNKKMKPTFHQIHKMEELKSYGAKCIVATSIEDLQKEGL